MYWTTLEISAPRCALMCYPSSNITYCIACLLCIGVILLNKFNSIQFKVPDPRDHLSTWNEWARSIAIGCALSNLSCGRSSGRYRPVSKSAAVGTRLLDLLLPLLGTRALSRVFNRLRHVKADTRTLISKVLQSSKPYSHTNKINK